MFIKFVPLLKIKNHFGTILEVLSFKKIKMKNLILILTILFSTAVFANDIYDKVATAIKSGNAKELAAMFDNSIEITILESEQTYSKAQAEQVVKDFFLKNPPKTFEVIHRGSSNEGSKYGIGTLTASGKTFRVYFLVKQKGQVSLIQELRFEKE